MEHIVYVVVDNRISEYPYEVTFSELENCLRELGWEMKLHKGNRRGAGVLLDDENKVVAVEKGYENEAW